MAWTQCLTADTTEGTEFEPGVPFALKLEGDITIPLKLQSKRMDDETAEWSDGEILKAL